MTAKKPHVQPRKAKKGDAFPFGRQATIYEIVTWYGVPSKMNKWLREMFDDERLQITEGIKFYKARNPFGGFGSSLQSYMAPVLHFKNRGDAMLFKLAFAEHFTTEEKRLRQNKAA